MKPTAAHAIVVLLAAVTVDGWWWWGMGGGGGEEEKVAAALCPEPGDILPCVCTNSSLSYMRMDCSEVLDAAQLAAVFSAYFPVTNFHKLTIANNPWLRTLPDGVFGDVTFKIFSVHGGVLETVEDGALSASFTTAEQLMFHRNDITIFPLHLLSSFTKLTVVSLADNSLQDLPDLASSTLEHLYLDGNPLGEVAASTFAATPALSVIYLQETGLQEIASGTFTGLSHLEMVYLFRNQLTEVPESAVTFNFTHGSVFLSLNNISTVAVNAFPGLTGGTVEVQGNAITELLEEVWRPLLEEGVNIRPYNNPLVCGCDIAWLLNTSFIGQIEPMLTHCEDGQLLALLDPANFTHC